MGIYQSCVLISKDKWLWVRPFSRYGKVIGFIIPDMKESEEIMFKNIKKEICPKKGVRPPRQQE